MGFCRRCGDIVVGQRCGKCGGTSVAPAVKWSAGDDDGKQDRWTKTYVTKPESAKPVNDVPLQPSYTGQNTSPTKRFTRALGSANTIKPALSSRVSAHIASATSTRPPSKPRSSMDASMVTESHAEQGILPSPHGSELAKVYGSVLQPKETLASFHCAICSTVFAPDATIYPDPSSLNAGEADGMPSSSTARFLCKPCFTVNGGSKGNCPVCHRPVLILKSEGGFVETSGQVWHKKCFCCEGCGKNIGDQPMADLLGRPCCVECFDTCLKRPAKSMESPARFATSEKSKIGNLGGGLDRGMDRDREGSPALDELEARLGISKSRDSAPAVISVGRLNMAERGSPFVTPNNESSRRYSTSSSTPANSTTRLDSDLDDLDERASPRRHSRTSLNDVEPFLRSRARRSRSRTRESSDYAENLPTSSSSTPRKQPTEEAIEEMKRRFLSGNGSPAITPAKPSVTPSPSTTPRRRSRSRPRASLGDADGIVSGRSTPALRKAISTNSLRSALLSQSTGETELGFETDLGTESELGGFNLIPDRTGESTQPLRIRRNRTGNSEFTEIERDLTGVTTTGFSSVVEQSVSGGFSADDDLLDRYNIARPVRTSGDIGLGYESSADMSDIQEPTRSHRTGDKTAVPRQRTGDRSVYPRPTGDREVRRQATGSRVAHELDPAAKLSASASSSSGSAMRYSARGNEDSVSSLNSGLNHLALRHESGSFSTSSAASSGYESSVSSTPDLASDYSDATSSRSSLPATPPPSSPPLQHHNKLPLNSKARDITPTRSKRAQTFSHLLGLSIPEEIPPDTRCEKCRQPLFNSKSGGKFVTVPEEPSSTGALPKRYHTACFNCKVCGEAFEEKEGGHAVFVRVPEGACHVRCAPPERITLRKVPPTPLFKPSKIPVASNSPDRHSSNTDAQTAFYSSSSRYERPPPTAPPTTTSFSIPQPRFGGSTTCPGCHKAVSPMERGVVPGPQGSKWHGGCLICGGHGAKGRRKQDGKAGCGKKLDSAAKTDAEGSVWCRECLLLLPIALRQASAARSPIVSMNTGTGPFSRVAPQTTGTTIARQFTGIGSSASSDAELLRQLTGGGISSARQLSSSPTKLYDGPRPGRMYPRPKSVTGTRSTSGEGRGMFLVRQLTGGNSSFSGNEYGL